jgi:hypothetical protein
VVSRDARLSAPAHTESSSGHNPAATRSDTSASSARQTSKPSHDPGLSRLSALRPILSIDLGQARGRILVLILLTAVAVTAGCGSSKNAAPPSTSTSNAPPATTTGQAPGALQGEAQSAATGDIPDNQVYVAFANSAAGYTIKYPEGWAQSGKGKVVVFRDKNNLVRIVTSSGKQATPAIARADMGVLHRAVPSLKFQAPVSMRISGAPAIKVTYTTMSAPNQVTGKRVTLTVDRYYLFHAGKRAVVDLGTPVGVDNVDAYRMMIQSFRWR